MTSALLGGVGLFLLGVTLMTDGLKAAAGGALRNMLHRFTGGPFRAFLSGAALTMIMQSSSATVVMTIGFVSAGLLAFTQAIGIVFGASVGTTSTSWLVAFFGLRYSMSILALPLVGIGALTRLLGRGRLASVGLVIAGFGLIFVGVDTLQSGMNALSSRVQLTGISATELGGRALLMAIGAGMTVIMQSSTAAVATTLAALHSGTVDLEQAAALVIGQNVGTTVTAALASIGASVPARRTALSQIILNCFSGLIAFVFFPVYLDLMELFQRIGGVDETASIAMFHTTLNLVGVALLLPFTGAYAALISRLVVDRSPPLTRFLDTSVLSVPSVAIEAARRTVADVATALVSVTRIVLAGQTLRRTERDLLEVAAHAAAETRAFLGRIRSSPDDRREYVRHMSALHAMDHAERLLEALGDYPKPEILAVDPNLIRVSAEAETGLGAAQIWLQEGATGGEVPDLEPLSRSIAELRRRHRPSVMARTASGLVDPETGLETLDAMRWIDRAVYHVWRAVLHLRPEGAADSGVIETFEDAPTRGERQESGVSGQEPDGGV